MLLEIKDVTKIYNRDNLEHIQVEARRQLFRYFINEALLNIPSQTLRTKVEKELIPYTRLIKNNSITSSDMCTDKDILLPIFVIYESDIEEFRKKSHEKVNTTIKEIIEKDIKTAKETIESNKRYIDELMKLSNELDK